MDITSTACMCIAKATGSSLVLNSSQCKIIPYFLFRELPKTGLDPSSDWSNTIFRCWDTDNTNFNRLFGHLTFKAFFEREKGGVDGVF